MAKIALDSDFCSAPPSTRLLAQGNGWTAYDIVCNSGPHDRPFEEQHTSATVAMVVGGTFQYRSRTGREMMTPGSLLLGTPGQCFECGHEHGKGDRCISFAYTTEFFERLAHDVGAPDGFKGLRVPPLRVLSPLIARASAGLMEMDRAESQFDWENLGIHLAAQALQLDAGVTPEVGIAQAGATARVTRVLRMIEGEPDAPHDITGLAREARLSPYHFLRTFEGLTGVTPHQYLLRMRLRRAAVRLATERTRILDIAFDCGFGDVSNFNRTFRAEFSLSPREYRRTAQP